MIKKDNKGKGRKELTNRRTSVLMGSIFSNETFSPKVFLFLFIFLFTFNFVLADYSNCEIYGNCQPISTSTTTSSTNYSLVNVNDSLYWQGHTGTDGSWLTGISGMNYNNLLLDNRTNTPTTNATYDWGSSLLRWLNGWFVNLFVSSNITTTNVLSTNGVMWQCSNSTDIYIGNTTGQCT